MEEIKTKTCSKCKIEKNLTEFSKNDKILPEHLEKAIELGVVI